MSAVADQDLLSPELTKNPFAYFAELRASDPVHWAPASKAWLLTRYDDVVAAFGDPRLSSDRVRPLLDVLPAQRRAEYGPMLEIISRWMVVTDPPVHTRLNRLASRAFRQQRVSAMSGWIGELVEELLDDFVASGGDDFLAGLAYPLPAAVIARMMGVPQQDRGTFQHWSDELALVAFGAGGQDRAGRYARALAGVRELQEYLAGLIERRRREPGEDMISLLLGGADEDGDHLDDAELMALCSLILFAGHETTTNLLCNAIVTLDRHPRRAGPAASRCVPGQPGDRGSAAVRGPDQDPDPLGGAGSRAGGQTGQGGGPRVPGAAVGQPRQGHVRRPGPLRHRASRQTAARRLRPRTARLPGRAAGPHRGPRRPAEGPRPARGIPRHRRRDLAAEHRVPRGLGTEGRPWLR